MLRVLLLAAVLSGCGIHVRVVDATWGTIGALETVQKNELSISSPDITTDKEEEK